MLDIIPAIWWKYFFSRLSAREAWSLACRLSPITKDLYNIFTKIKQNNRFVSLRKISIPPYIYDCDNWDRHVQSTLIQIAKQYKTSQKWTVYIPKYGTELNNIEHIIKIINTLDIFNIAFRFNGLQYYYMGRQYNHTDDINYIRPIEKILIMASKHISSLDVSSAKLFGLQSVKLWQPLSEMTQLTSLNLSGNLIDQVDDIEALTLCIRKFTQLQLLDLGNNKLGCNGSQSIKFWEALSVLSRLTSLNLSCNSIHQVDDIAGLAQCIPNFTQLQLLDLGNNALNYYGFSILVPSIAKLSQLTSLNFNYTYLSKTDLRLFISIDLSKLTTFNIGNNGITKGCKQLSMVLDTMPRLTSLDLSSTYIKDFSKVTPSFEKLSHLRELLLRGNNMCKLDAMAIIESVSELPNIKVIILSDNRIGNNGIISILDILPYFRIIPRLKLLDLEFNNLDETTRKKLLKNSLVKDNHNIKI
jgi:Ran GTPase-activating protein (RanGAP) involved in mRNA processing and transport